MKKDRPFYHPMEISDMGALVCEAQGQLQQLREKIDRSHDREFPLLVPLPQGIGQLKHLFGVLQAELEECPGEPSISCAGVENEIAKCIAGCLAGDSSPTPSIAHIRALLVEHRVVRPLSSGRCSVSLQGVHVILQDNFSDSSLCGLLNIMMAGFMGVETKVISF